jgi:NADH dehydrogenase
VTAVDASGVTIGTARIDARTVIWAAGVAASPAGQWIGAKCDRAGRIEVNPELTVPDHPEIFAIGDTALMLDAAGKPLPGVAPVAKQQGRYVGNLIKLACAAESELNRSPIATMAISPPLGARPLSSILAGFGCAALWPG